MADVSAANKNSMSHRDSLLRSLADGSYHSGEDLAASLGVTRAAVWKQIKKLASLGLQVESERGRGYRLAAPIELLDPERLRALNEELVETQADLERLNREWEEW